MSKKIIQIITLAFLLVTLTVSVAAFLTSFDDTSISKTVGFVEIDYKVYFDRDGEPDLPASFAQITLEDESTYELPGIYYVNVSNPTDPEYISNLRVDIDVKSNVNTYFRVSILPQLGFVTTSANGRYTINQTIEAFDFNIDTNAWYNFDKDGQYNQTSHFEHYYYYKTMVLRDETMNNSPTTISFINGYSSIFESKHTSYGLYLTIRVEAVQALFGPQNNWGFPEKPWGGNW